MITLQPYTPATFFTPRGAAMKVRQLVKRGFPENLRNWRFLTLTVDRSRYEGPEQAYEICSRHLPEFFFRLREAGYAVKRYAWKMEFHQADENGDVFAHWHVLLDYKRPIPAELIRKLWGKGRTEIKGVRDRGFEYLFKYVAKSVDDIPQWVERMKRIRLFQTSRGFFAAGDGVAKERKPSPRHGIETTDTDTQNEVSRLRAETIGERMKRWSRSVISCSDSDCGQFKRHRVHILVRGVTWGGLLVATARHMLGAKTSPSNLKLDTYKIETSCLRHLPISQFLYQLAHT